MDTPLPSRGISISGSSESDATHPPSSLQGFHLLRNLGEGGMGTVFLAFNTSTRQRVALKLLAENLAADRIYVDRFYREARIGVTLRHPNVVQTIGYGRDRATGRHFMELEYVDGPSCQYLLDRDGRVAMDDAVLVAYHIAKALEHLHAHRVIHRDVKPDNILLSAEGLAKLADLGLAKQMGGAEDLTAQYSGFGTSWYMPYEQAKNAGFVDGRSDIFSLGATLYHLLTGSVPFPGDSHAEVVAKKQADQFVPASQLNSDVPPALDAILARMLALDPRKRYATARDLIVEIEKSRLLVARECVTAARTGGGRVRHDPATVDVAATNPDLRMSDTDRTPIDQVESQWHLRFRDKHGRDFNRQATTAQVLSGLRSGRWPDGTEAARSARNHFRPLGEYPEFRVAVAVRDLSQKALAGIKDPSPRSRVNRKILLIAGFGVGLLVAATLASFIRGWMGGESHARTVTSMHGSIPVACRSI